jgi:hypothetical protein
MILAGNTNSQSNFEGKMLVKISGDDAKGNMNYSVKGDLVRVDFDFEDNDEKMTMIIDTPNKRSLMLMPEQKMYMEYSLDDPEIKEGVESYMGKAKMTGETKEINGYTCEKILFTDEDDNISEIWATKELGVFKNFVGNMNQSENPEWLPNFMREGFFPILGIQRDEDGEEEYRWEVVKVEKQPVSSDLFEPPSGYKKFEIPGMDLFK